MRGHADPQSPLFSYFSVEERIPADHPLRRIKPQADAVLASMSSSFDAMYAQGGRPSVPPERLLKASVLIALYTVRSDRLFCEMLDYNMLFRWFLDMGLEERSFDHSTFSKNREQLIEHEIAKEFFAGVIGKAREHQLLSDEHFTVDGTLIEAWASFKSLKRKAPLHHPMIRKQLPGFLVAVRVGQLGALGGVLDILVAYPVLHELQLPPRVKQVGGDGSKEEGSGTFSID